MVERDVELGEVAFMARLHVGDERFGRDADFLGGEHDRRAVGIVRADKMHRAPGHALRAHPDIGLHVTDQVAEVQHAVGIGQGAGDERGGLLGRHRRESTNE